MGNAAITFLPKDPTLTWVMVTKLRAAFGIAQSILTDIRSLYHGSKSDILRVEKETQPKIMGIIPY